MEERINQTTTKDKGILTKICKNILDYPNQSKYRNLNSNRISQKFASPNNSIDLLFDVGFKRCGNRLIMDKNDIDKAKKMYLLLINNETDINNVLLPKIIELMRLDVPVDEAELGLAMSFDCKQKINDDMDMEEAVQCLAKNGFDLNKSMNAIVSAKYDIRQALEILIHDEMKDRNDMKGDNHEEMEANEKYAMLISMGYDKKNESNYECKANTKDCDHLLLIKLTLKTYHSLKNILIKSHILALLNSFHHLLNEHDSNAQFEEIYRILGECNISKCNRFRRNRRDRSIEQHRVLLLDEILDKIHCHFC
eukprot:438743_1